jgi:Polyprenyl synthetase
MIEPYLVELRLSREPGLDVAMRYPLAGGGKRIRPRLTLAAARAGGADPALALPAAAAVELVHTCRRSTTTTSAADAPRSTSRTARRSRSSPATGS